MTYSSYVKTVLVLSLGGVLFAGYLSAVKIFSDTCAFNEPCPYFLGYPACWYGFVMYSVMFLATLTAFVKRNGSLCPVKINALVALFGILFAGYFVSSEFRLWMSSTENLNYSLGLPTCTYGLIFYIIIFILSSSYLLKSPQN